MESTERKEFECLLESGMRTRPNVIITLVNTRLDRTGRVRSMFGRPIVCILFAPCFLHSKFFAIHTSELAVDFTTNADHKWKGAYDSRFARVASIM